LEKTRKVESFNQQFLNVAGNLLGPSGLLSGMVIYFVAFVIGQLEAPTTLLPKSAPAALLQFAIMELAGDFLLYCGHRIQHDNEYLYKISHSFHHTLETPTPLGTGYVKTLDGVLQHALPVAILMVVVRPHPLTLYIYICSRISESVWNHSGIDHEVVDLITFKFLPFRAPIAHHDAHHKYSSYSKNAKNFGEAFWIWDYVFGTYSAYRNVKHT
jgi:sterol desaturase/sphingolipid hydroxylase (fatty acid hydroxylase superfamily)